MQLDKQLEEQMGRADIYIHPETNENWLEWYGSTLRPELIVVETDLFKAFLYLGERRRQRKARGGPAQGFRKKTPYSRLIPDAVMVRGILICEVQQGNKRLAVMFPYYDAVSPDAATAAMYDRVEYKPFMWIRPSTEGTLEEFLAAIRLHLKQLNSDR